jgi:hypothetical protein
MNDTTNSSELSEFEYEDDIYDKFEDGDKFCNTISFLGNENEDGGEFHDAASFFDDEDACKFNQVIGFLGDENGFDDACDENDEGEYSKVVDKCLEVNMMESYSGGYAPYFENATTAMLFCWVHKHKICE